MRPWLALSPAPSPASAWIWLHARHGLQFLHGRGDGAERARCKLPGPRRCVQARSQAREPAANHRPSLRLPAPPEPADGLPMLGGSVRAARCHCFRRRHLPLWPADIPPMFPIAVRSSSYASPLPISCTRQQGPFGLSPPSNRWMQSSSFTQSWWRAGYARCPPSPCLGGYRCGGQACDDRLCMLRRNLGVNSAALVVMRSCFWADCSPLSLATSPTWSSPCRPAIREGAYMYQGLA